MVAPVAVAVAAAVALLSVLLAARHGLAWTNDSVAYTAAAGNLVESGRLDNFDGRPLTWFPPGLPLTLAAAGWLGVPVMVAALACNAAAVGATVVLTARVTAQVTGSAAAGVAAAWMLAVSPWTIRVHSMLWSEPLFTLAVACWLGGATAVVKAERLTAGRLCVLVVSTWAACLFRYAGACLVLCTALVLLHTVVGQRRGSLADKSRRLAVAMGATGLAAAGLVGVVAFNAGRDGTLLGPRGTALSGPGDAFGQLFGTLSGVLSGADPSSRTAQVCGAGLVVALAAYSAFSLVSRWRERNAPGRPAMALLPGGLFLAVYGAVLVYSEASTTVDPIDLRLLYPAAPALVLVLVALASSLPWQSALGAAGRHRTARASVLALVVTWMAVAAAAGLVRGWAQGTPVADAPSLSWSAATDRLPAGAALISNQPFRLAKDTGRDPVRPAVGTLFFAAVTHTQRGRELHAYVREHPVAYLVWLGGGAAAQAESLRAFGVDSRCEPPRSWGVICRLTAR